MHGQKISFQDLYFIKALIGIVYPISYSFTKFLGISHLIHYSIIPLLCKFITTLYIQKQIKPKLTNLFYVFNCLENVLRFFTAGFERHTDSNSPISTHVVFLNGEIYIEEEIIDYKLDFLFKTKNIFLLVVSTDILL